MTGVLCYTLNPAFDLAIGLPRLQPGTVHRAQSSRMDPAGKGLNVARVLRRLGHPVRVAGLLGRANAEPFHQLFRQESLEPAFIEIDGATRINVKLAEDDGRVSDLNGPGLPIREADWQRLLAAMPAQLAGMSAVVVSGSLPPGVSVPMFADWLQALRRYELPVWVDTSGPGLEAVRLAGVDLLKPNEEELAQLLQHALPAAALPATAAQVIRHGWAGQVLLSLGGDGACWLSDGTGLQARPPQVAVQNTVCAGDTLLAAALHGELSGWPRARSLRYAVALSAECVRHVGPGDPAAPDLPALLDQVCLDPPIVPLSAPEMPE